MSEANGQQLPKGWASVPIGELFEVIGGGTPNTSEPHYWNGSIPWISSADIYDDFTLAARRWVTSEGLKNSPCTAVPNKSVIVVTRVGLGKIGSVVGEPLCFSQDCQALLPVAGVDDRFTAYQMKWTAIHFLRQSRGTTISGITKKQLNDTLFSLPPSAEQQRIADALDELLSDLYAGVAALERVQAKLKHYRAAVLKAAVEGALTAEWRAQHPATEPASALLTRILAERRRRWEEAQLKKFKEAGKAPPKDWKAKYKDRGWGGRKGPQELAPEMQRPHPAAPAHRHLVCQRREGQRALLRQEGRPSRAVDRQALGL